MKRREGREGRYGRKGERDGGGKMGGVRKGVYGRVTEGGGGGKGQREEGTDIISWLLILLTEYL